MVCRTIAVMTLVAIPVSADTEVRVWTMNSMERIDPLNALSGKAEVKLAAARNEYEAFQIAVQADGRRITVKDVLFDDLVGEGGRKISSKNAVRYREHCVYLRRPSPTSTARIGLYADALVPFVSPIDGSAISEWRENNPKGAKYVAIPRHVYPGFTETFWIDLYVPSDTEPGDYKGQIRVNLAGLSPVTVPVELHVWAFSLPETPTVRSHFGGFHRVADAHGVKPGTAEARVIEERYLTAMADHRITPDVPRYLLPVARPDGSIDPSPTHEKLAAFVKQYHVNAIAVPFGFTGDPAGKNRALTIKYLAAMQAYLADHGWLDGAYIYIQDEPNTKEEYEEVRRRAAVAHEAAPKIRVLCTEQTKPSDPNWGDLYGAVDIWVPLWPLHDEATAAKRLAAGEQLWSYTALCQCGDKPLFWQIDFPPLNYRVWAWINYRYQMTGLLYWTSAYWGHVKDPWLDQPSFRLAYNGEGMLFYPGRDAGFDGPVVSMRLKQIREGMEDYEYLYLLEQKAGREKAQAFAKRIGRSWLDWERQPAKLLEARAELARAIEAPGR
jgi:hypothetical protein